VNLVEAVKAVLLPPPSAAEIDSLAREAATLAMSLEQQATREAATPVTRGQLRAWLAAGSVPSMIDTSHHAAVLARAEAILDRNPGAAGLPSSPYSLAQAVESLRGAIAFAEQNR
jgi:hypothetical protein